MKISGLDVVEGSVRICVRSMAGGPGRGLSGANDDDDSVLVAVVGDIGMVGGRAVWAAQVVTFDMSGLVWCKPGSWRAFRDAQVAVGGLAGSGGCHRVVTSGAKHGGTQGDTLRRFVRISGRGGTGWDG